jgi:4-carboxymuconolactone decarboxylase
MPRLPVPRREDIAPEHQALYDHLGAVRSGTVGGPYSVLIRVPTLAERLDGVSGFFRDDVSIPKPDLELGALTAVRETGARFAWNRHELAAKRVGTRPEAVEAVRAQAPVDGLTPREQIVVEVVRSLLRTRSLSDDLFARAQAELGAQQLIELVALAGHYTTISYVLNAFDVPPPDDSPTF